MSDMTNAIVDEVSLGNLKTEVETNMEFQNAVHNFYKLKSEYDEQLRELRRKIAKKKGLSIKEKRDEYKKLKPSCVNCKRKVGSIFEVKYDTSTDGRIAKALCGDRIDPCPLDIEINLGKIRTIASDLQATQEEMNGLKKQIVIIKNDLLFGYTTTDKAVDEFEKIKTDLSSTTEMYEILLVSYVSIYDSPEKKAETQKLELEIYHNINQIKDYIRDFNRQQDVQYVQDAATLLISQLTPKVEDLRRLKYPIMTVSKSDNQCSLVQKSLDYTVTENDSAVNEHGVVTFNVGVSVEEKKDKKRRK